MSATAEQAVPLSLEVDCDRSEQCRPMAEQLLGQLGSGAYDEAALMAMPTSFDDYIGERRTARKRALRARRMDYRFETIERERYVADIYAINTSCRERQGRPMSQGYRERPRYSPLPRYECERHTLHTYGVLRGEDRLCAYAFVYRCGELAMVSTILGHALELENGIMYLLLTEIVREQADEGGWLYYNRYDSGTDGLRFLKDRIGLERALVDWRP